MDPTITMEKIQRATRNLAYNLVFLAKRRLLDAPRLEQQPTENVADLHTHIQQLNAVLTLEGKLPPPPPKHLQVRVVGGYAADFIESGYRICEDLDQSLAPAGQEVANFKRVLDFGCGCGRISRALKNLHKGADVYGSDIDGEAIKWLQDNCASVGTFVKNPHRPKTDFDSNFFDFIFSVSVLTHLPEDMQFEWLAELQRITKSGGYLMLSTHGKNHYAALSAPEQAELRKKGFAYKAIAPTDGLPEFYQSAFHTAAYIKEKWAPYFEVIDIAEQLIDDRQDAVLLRKR